MIIHKQINTNLLNISIYQNIEPALISVISSPLSSSSKLSWKCPLVYLSLFTKKKPIIRRIPTTKLGWIYLISQNFTYRGAAMYINFVANPNRPIAK